MIGQLVLISERGTDLLPVWLGKRGLVNYNVEKDPGQRIVVIEAI